MVTIRCPPEWRERQPPVRPALNTSRNPYCRVSERPAFQAANELVGDSAPRHLAAVFAPGYRHRSLRHLHWTRRTRQPVGGMSSFVPQEMPAPASPDASATVLPVTTASVADVPRWRARREPLVPGRVHSIRRCIVDNIRRAGLARRCGVPAPQSDRIRTYLTGSRGNT